mgnify:CR=1 FL=1
MITGKAYDVYNELDYGLLESAYEAALEWELQQVGMTVEHEVMLPIYYKGHRLDKTYRIDLMVNRKVIIELKTVDILGYEHLNYMRLTHTSYGMLINFGPDGVRSEKYLYDGNANTCELIDVIEI